MLNQSVLLCCCFLEDVSFWECPLREVPLYRSVEIVVSFTGSNPLKLYSCNILSMIIGISMRTKIHALSMHTSSDSRIYLWFMFTEPLKHNNNLFQQSHHNKALCIGTRMVCGALLQVLYLPMLLFCNILYIGFSLNFGGSADSSFSFNFWRIQKWNH